MTVEEQQETLSVAELKASGSGLIEEAATEAVEEAPAEAEPAEAEAATEAEATTEAVADEYTPDLSYKVYDEVKEFPDWVKDLVKTKELEETVRGVLSKADALDTIKLKHEERGTKLGEVQGNYDNIVGKLNELQHYIDGGPALYGELFKQIGLDNQQVVDYVAQLLKENDLDPQEKARLQSHRQIQVDQFQQTKQQQALLDENRRLQADAHEAAYQRVLSLPEVAKVQAYVDQHTGAGAFRKAADNYGQAFFQQHGKDTTPEQAVSQIMEQYKPFLNNIAATTASDLAAAKRDLDDGRPTGVIPNVGKANAGTSPVRKKVKSLEDIRKLAANMN
jgi:hypothetical protein